LKLETLLSRFDSYTRVARIYPAFLVITPVLWTIATLNPGLVMNNVARTVLSLLGTCGIVYLMASVARWTGKKVERRLIRELGGGPTTILLRHSNRVIDPMTKARYHARLCALCPDLLWPSVQDENARPREADDTYRSATRRLIELRRDAKWSLVHGENASYGFRRNILGLRPIAFAIAIACGLMTLGAWLNTTEALHLGVRQIPADIQANWHLYALFSLDVVWIGIFASIVTPKFVTQAGREYGEALFRTLDSDP
jgi:hypothetical protein